MRTVVENWEGLDNRTGFRSTIDYETEEKLSRSCFYEFGVSRSVDYAGFVDSEDIPFIDSLSGFAG